MSSISMELQRESLQLLRKSVAMRPSVIEAIAADITEVEDEESHEDKSIIQEPDKAVDGALFAYIGIPYACLAFIYLIFRTATLIAGFGWSRNSLAEILDLKEKQTLERSSSIVLDIHCYLGMLLIAMIAYQYLSANFFSSKNEATIRFFHRVVGRSLVVLWPICILAGCLFFVFRYKGRGPLSNDVSASALVSGLTGALSLGNLAVGYFSIAHRPKHLRNYFQHKACMFFSMHYAIGFTTAVFAVMVIQSIFWDSCDISVQGETMGIFVGFALQTLGLVVCMYIYDKNYFREKAVYVNFCLLVFHNLVFLFLLVASFVLVEPEDGTCFASL